MTSPQRAGDGFLGGHSVRWQERASPIPWRHPRTIPAEHPTGDPVGVRPRSGDGHHTFRLGKSFAPHGPKGLAGGIAFPAGPGNGPEPLLMGGKLGAAHDWCTALGRTRWPLKNSLVQTWCMASGTHQELHQDPSHPLRFPQSERAFPRVRKCHKAQFPASAF